MLRYVPTLLASLLLAALTPAQAFELHSPEIADGATLTNAQVFAGFGCSGENISPALAWSAPPPGTKSYALTVYDPDAPTGSGWWHWVVYDIPAGANSLARGIGKSAQLPAGAKQGRSDFSSRDFGGACPPPGDKPHRYQFTIYALKVDKLDVADDASPALIGFMINSNQIGKAGFTAYYGR